MRHTIVLLRAPGWQYPGGSESGPGAARENPLLTAISATRAIESVILRGRLLDREGRDRLLAKLKDLGRN